MYLLKMFTIVLLMIIAGLLIEKLMHIEENTVENLARYLVQDVRGVFRGLKKEIVKMSRERHCFDEILWVKMKKTVEDYVAKGFEVDYGIYEDTDINHPIRYIKLGFCLDKIYSDEELLALTALEREQFRRYLRARNLVWKNFAYYIQNEMYICIMIYYAEFEDEEAALAHKADVCKKEAIPQVYGVIIDDELNRELESAD